MRYVVIILLLLLMACTVAILACIIDAMDYDPSWDEAPEEQKHDDAG